MRYLYGSSADAIANQEMGRDSARDQRFFQSIAAQRASQQQLDSELYRQAAFQSQQQQQARQAAQYEAQQRRLWSKQQQDLELGLERVGAQRDIGNERNRFLEAKMLQDRDLAEGRMGLMADRYQFLSEKTNPADVRLAQMDAEEQDINSGVERYRTLQRERDALREAQTRVGAMTGRQDRFMDANTKWYLPDATNAREAFVNKAEETLREFYPAGLPVGHTAKMPLTERVALADSELKTRLADITEQLDILSNSGITKYLNRPPASAGALPSTPPLLSRPSEVPLGGGGGGGTSIAPARVIADAKAAIARGKDPQWILQQAKEKYGVDLSPYLR